MSDQNRQRRELEKTLSEKRAQLKTLQDEIRAIEKELQALNESGRARTRDSRRSDDRDGGRDSGSKAKRTFDKETLTITVVSRGRQEGHGGSPARGRSGSRSPVAPKRDHSPVGRNGRGGKGGKGKGKNQNPNAVKPTSSDGGDIFDAFEKCRPVSNSATHLAAEVQKEEKEEKEDDTTMEDTEVGDWAAESEAAENPKVMMKIDVGGREEILTVNPRDDPKDVSLEFCRKFDIGEENADQIVAEILIAREEGRKQKEKK